MDMAAKAIHMKQLKQILRLHRDGFSINEIVRHTGISWPTVKKYLLRVQNVLSEDLEKEILNDKDLSAAVYNNNTITIKGERYTQLLEHFMYAETELKKTGVTRQLLWLEYKEQYADGYNYSQYCYHLSEFLKNKEVVMHLEHTAGEKIMVDFAGAKRSYVDIESGEVIECHIFVAVLPHSGLIFCHAVHSQSTYDFLSCINEMLKFFGGTTLTILCDNLKTAVTRSDRYEPVFTDMCNQLSEHYGTSFSATRPFKPRDKAMVEGAVKIIYNHISKHSCKTEN
jgi:transposase